MAKKWVMQVMTDEKTNELFGLMDDILSQYPDNHDDVLDMVTGKLFAMYTDPTRAVFNAEQVKQLVLLRNLLGSLNEMRDMPIIGDMIRKLLEGGRDG